MGTQEHEQNIRPMLSQFNSLKFTCDELFALFCQVKDVFGLRLGNFEKREITFAPMELFNEIKKSAKSIEIGDMSLDFSIKEIGLPLSVVGDRKRLSYLIRKLLKNAMLRS